MGRAPHCRAAVIGGGKRATTCVEWGVPGVTGDGAEVAVNPVVAQVVNRLHVSASDREVIRAVWQAFSEAARGREFRLDRKGFYRAALEQHRRNRELYGFVMTGR